MTPNLAVLRVEVLRVPFSDMDILGHASHIAYFRYMQEARVAWVRSLLDRLPADEAPVVVAASCNYLRPVVYPATLEVVMTGGDVGRSSFGLRYEMREADTGQAAATGETRMVWMDRGTGRSAPLPDVIRALLQPSS